MPTPVKSSSWLASDLEYSSFADWAFRRPAPSIRTPSIVRHIAYWIADYGTARREKIFSDLADYLQAAKEFQCLPSTLSTAAGQSKPQRFQTYRLWSDNWQGLPFTITLEIHREYLTVSAKADLSKLGDVEKPTALVIKLRGAIDGISEVTNERYRQLWVEQPANEPLRSLIDVRADLVPHYNDIFLKVWGDIETEILQTPLTKIGYRLRNRRVADFLGFVATCPSSDASHVFFSKSAPAPDRAKFPRRFTSDESIKLAHTILPFMTAEAQVANKADEKQLTVTRFLDGRCIYASTLGATAPESETKEDAPINYFVLTTGINSWQMGRLVDTLHTLGTVRLMARRYLEPLRAAGRGLHDLEQSNLKRIEELLKNYDLDHTKQSNLTRREEMPKGPDLDQTTTDVMRRLAKASSELFDIRMSVRGGVPYRVERSRYYRSQFKSLLITLRIGRLGRIEGFQPYDEFVERRFGSTYDFIDMVGKRFNRLERQLSDLYQRVLTTETARLQRETARETKAIQDFQEVAELGFFLVLFPYYTSMLLSHFGDFVAEISPRLSKDAARSKSVFDFGFTIIAFTLGFYFLRSLRQKHRSVWWWRALRRILGDRTTTKEAANTAASTGRSP
jgi:Protein of unknown function (DUF3422)